MVLLRRSCKVTASLQQNLIYFQRNNLHSSVRLTNNVVADFFADNSTDKSSVISSTNTLSKQLQNEVRYRTIEIEDFLMKTRRKLHTIPELMYNEAETSSYIQSILRKLDIKYTTGWAINKHYPDVIPHGPGGYGIVADIGSGEKPCVLLRADMDGLPILEQTEGIDFTSKHNGRMHACGHDGHSAMLLGACAILKKMEHSIKGTIRCMFQPAEEGGAGAKRMVEEGILDMEPIPQQAFGLHLWPTIPSGSIACRSGALFSACDRFQIKLEGVGGHAAMPHLAVDPIVTMSATIMNLQSIVSRNLSPLDSGVCSITQVQAGNDVYNVLPPTTMLRGTIRALSTEKLLVLKDRLEQIVRSTANMYGCKVVITYTPDFYPALLNDKELYDTFSKHVASLISDEGRTRDIEPTMAAEDFGFLSEKVPSTFFLLGQGSNNQPPSNYGLHNPNFAIDENVLPRGVELHVNLALRALSSLQKQQQQQ